jgi:hypothetical protein
MTSIGLFLSPGPQGLQPGDPAGVDIDPAQMSQGLRPQPGEEWLSVGLPQHQGPSLEALGDHAVVEQVIDKVDVYVGGRIDGTADIQQGTGLDHAMATQGWIDDEALLVNVVGLHHMPNWHQTM